MRGNQSQYYQAISGWALIVPKSIKALGLGGFTLGKMGQDALSKRRQADDHPSFPGAHMAAENSRPISLVFLLLPGPCLSNLRYLFPYILALLVKDSFPDPSPAQLPRDPVCHLQGLYPTQPSIRPLQTPQNQKPTPQPSTSHIQLYSLRQSWSFLEKPAPSPIITFQLQNTALNTRVCPNHN